MISNGAIMGCLVEVRADGLLDIQIDRRQLVIPRRLDSSSLRSPALKSGKDLALGQVSLRSCHRLNPVTFVFSDVRVSNSYDPELSIFLLF